MANQSSPNGGLRELALFAGAGGGLLASKLLGWRTVCAVEIDSYAASVLVARQNDGSLEAFPIWDNVLTFRGHEWRGLVDVVSGGFPCTDISPSGTRAGINGAQSGLWKEMLRVVREIRPRYVFVENSSDLVGRGLGVVLGDLAESGFRVLRWACIPAAFTGAPQGRDRIWIVADLYGIGCKTIIQWDYSKQEALRRINSDGLAEAQYRASQAESVFLRMDDVVANRFHRLKAIGNGQVPAVARLAWETLTGITGDDDECRERDLSPATTTPSHEATSS